MQNQKEVEVGWKSSFFYEADASGMLQAGIDVYRLDLDYAFTQNGPDTLYQFKSNALATNKGQKHVILHPEDVDYQFDDAAINAGAYASYEFGVGRFSFTPGVRYSYSGFSKNHMISPRLQIHYSLARNTMLNIGTGIYYQKPLNRYVASAPANRSLRDERSIHFIAGVTHLLRDDLKFTLEGYYKRLNDLIVPAKKAGRVMMNEGDGWSSGFDVLLRKRFTDRYYGQVSYGYSVSKRNDHDGRGEYTASYNQPHSFSAILGYEINDHWFASAKWKYATGRPKDRFIVHENVLGNEDVMRFSKEITARNADRLPNFHLLTVRVDYRTQIGPVGLITFIELMNVYDRFNTHEDRFSELTGGEKGMGVGFMPGGGFKLEF